MSEKEEYRQYKYRFLELAIYCVGVMLNMICWMSLQPIEPQVQEAYGIDSSTTLAVGYVFFMAAIVMNFPANIILDMYGLRMGVLVGIFSTVIGMWFKAAINKSFPLVFVGQVIAAVGQPFLLNAPAKLAALWFGKNERVIAVTVAATSQSVGLVVSFMFPTFFTLQKSDDLDQQIQNDKDFVEKILFWQAIAGSVVCGVALVFFKEKPLTPPSPTHAEEVTTLKSYIQKIRDIFKNRNAVLLIVSFGLSISIQDYCGVAIGLTADSFDFSADDASIFGGLLMGGGIAGSIFFGLILEKSKKYKLTSMLIQLLSVLMLSVLICALVIVKQMWFVSLTYFLLGFVLVPAIPVGYDFLVELTHPIPESISSGLLMVCANFGGILLCLLEGAAVDNFGKEGALALLLLLLGMAVIVSFMTLFIREDLRRLRESNQDVVVKEVDCDSVAVCLLEEGPI